MSKLKLHVRLISPGGKVIEADDAGVREENLGSDTTRAYKGTSRPLGIDRWKWQAKQYAERLRISAEYKARLAK